MSKFVALIFISALISNTSTHALETNGVKLSVIDGSCSRSFYGDKAFECDKILSMESPANRRANYTVAIGDIVISFSGTNIIRRSNGRFGLELDSVIRSSNRSVARGVCNYAIEGEPPRYREIECVGVSEGTEFVLRFKGAPGQNIDRRTSKPRALAQPPVVSADKASLRLPFEDGTYVTEAALCRLTAQQITDRFGDGTGQKVRHISGKRLTDGYEMECDIQSVDVRHDNVRFRASCSSEGEANPVNGSWKQLDSKRFQIGQRTFSACGKSIWPRD